MSSNNQTLPDSVSREWLVTNGIGGYASSTFSGANSRRYHGLLVAALNPPTQRQVLVSKVEECIFMQRDSCVSLSTNYFPGIVHPNGFKYLKQTDRKPLSTMVFQVGEQQVSKTVFMVQHSNTTVVAYENTGNSSINLSLTPFYVYRDYHSLFRENSASDYHYDISHDMLKIYANYGAAPLYVRFTKGIFTEERYWFKNYEYEKERYRGLDFQEDAYTIGKIRLNLQPGEQVYLVFSLDAEVVRQSPEALKMQELQRLNDLVPTESENTFYQDLAVAADQFIVKRQSTQSYSIIAGYHWFTDWGRDTMIALRGLGIALGKQEICRSILHTFFQYISKGMLPNRFPDHSDEALEYNTMDATLWLFVTLYEYHDRFKDDTFIKDNFHHLTNILEAHFKGTRYDIHVTEEGFLYGGEGIAQLTWMDARVGDYVVTPRHGCPVEIQALWYNALKIYQYFSEQFSMPTTDVTVQCKTLREKIEANFPTWFLNEAGYLNDVVVPGGASDASVRPNQIYALSLPFPLLDVEHGKSMLKIVETQLFTPYGLRTLSPKHPDFKPVYKGNQWERDTAYHQGTVWTFLLADYFQAQLNVFGETPEILAKIGASLQALRQHFYESDCVHGSSEIFDGLTPGAGRGTVQQAWSVGALLQILTSLNHSKSKSHAAIA